jgi:hypothetical protein
MRVKLATTLTALICAVGAMGAVSVIVPTAGAAKPDLCEYECGGKWGAREHAKAFAEQHGMDFVEVHGCAHNSEYGAQWDCWGDGNRNNEYGLGYEYEFHVWMGEFGVEKHWTERGPLN